MRRVLFVVISVMLLISTALAYMVSTWTVANSMTVIKRDVNITAYSDEACTKPLTSLSWGEIKQGDRAEKIFWIKNVGKDNGTAAWYSDLEEKTDWKVYEEMYYWNETLGEWVYWCESWMPYASTPTPSPTPSPSPSPTAGEWVRIWPSEAPVDVCYDAAGNPHPATGVDSATWFFYGDCGSWKVFNVKPGIPLEIRGFGDECPECPGCVLGDINYRIYDYYEGAWHLERTVDGPDNYCSGQYGPYIVSYIPKGDKIKIVASTGFYVEVWQMLPTEAELPWMEPGDVVKVKYVIKTEASCEPGDYSWTLYLGWE